MKMKNHVRLLILICVLAFTSAAFGEDPERFQYTGDIAIHDNQDDFILLEISPEVYAGMNPGFKDLRLYYEGQELDYLVFPYENQQRSDGERTLDIFNKGIIDNTYSFEIMPPKEMHAGDIQYSVKLNASQYLIKAKIYGSNDSMEWKYLKTQTIYGIDGEYNKFRLENIRYDAIKIEYELLDREDMVEVDSVVYTQVDPISSKGVLRSVGFTSEENEGEKATEIIMDHQYTRYPTRGITLESKEKYFYRQVTVEGSNDKESWTEITRTFVFRHAVSEKPEINYDPQEYRYLKMMIFNEDNQPLEISDIKTEVLPLNVLVHTADKPKDFTIKAYWGDPTLPAPKYDIANLSISLDPLRYQKYTIHSYMENEAFMGASKQLPMTERFPWLMPVSLSVLALGALVFLYKTVKKV